MTDIAMCANQLCPSRLVCYRHEAQASEYRQSYGGFTCAPGEDKCGWFVALRVKGDAK